VKALERQNAALAGAMLAAAEAATS